MTPTPRYDNFYSEQGGEMRQTPEGKYVLHTDYTALQAKHDELEAELIGQATTSQGEMLCESQAREVRLLGMLNKAQNKNAELQAQAAVMRDAIETVLADSTGDPCYMIDEEGREMIRKALQSTAGEQLLRDVERMRTALESIRDTCIAMIDARRLKIDSVLFIEGPRRMCDSAIEALNPSQPTNVKP